MAYATVQDVEALVGDVVPGRVFTASTTPSASQVQAWLDQRAAEIDLHLRQAGIGTPVDSAEHPELHTFLRYINALGASALVLSSLPTEAYVDPSSQGLAVGRKGHLEGLYQRGLEALRSRTVSPTVQRLVPVVGSAEGQKYPFFTRHRFDYPGTRRLQGA